MGQNKDPISPVSGLSLIFRYPPPPKDPCIQPASGRSRDVTRSRAARHGLWGEASSEPTAVPILPEQILRTLKGYDSYNTLLLPPRVPGEKLPPELYEYFKEVKRSKEEQMKVKYLEMLAQENGEDSAQARLPPLPRRL